MKTAIVHDWLTGMRGGEKVLEAFFELFPDADLFTLVYVEGSVSKLIADRKIQTSFLDRIPLVKRYYRYALPIMPMAIETLDLTGYDLVISSSHCVAKGVVARPGAVHISYTHSPMRYIWDLWPRYFPPKGLKGALAQPLLTWLRTWDVTASARVDHFVANSNFVAERIERYYRRKATVIEPPVDVRALSISDPPGDTYLMVSALVESKGLEIAVRAFNELGRPLRIVGQGPLLKELRHMAGPNIELTGRLSDKGLKAAYRDARAIVHTAVEDFGIVALEAAASGRPVIALGVGGSLETVVPTNPREGRTRRRASGEPAPAPTGVFFYEAEAASLVRAVREFEALPAGSFPREALVAHAEPFDREEFKRRFRALVDEALQGRC
ncbi:MAG: glycosyltransferase involved in cell wall biosynthesis [Planctomycetota bacterium]|jgi:glycosyltransferase involved in cell wall biosynthesis